MIRYPPERPHRQCRTIGAAEQDAWGQGQAHTFLGMIAASTAGDRARAAAHYRAAVDFLRPSHDVTLLPVALIGQAGVLERRDPARALRVAAAASAIRTQAGGDFAPFYRVRLEAIRAAAEAAVGADAQRLWADGALLGVDGAIALAFGTQTPRRASPAGLSSREAEVAALVSEGLSNKAIAARLHLSVRTVESQVRHALSKVGLDNPTQTEEQADQAIAHMRTLGPVPPEGARLLFGGPANPGWRFVSVWDSQDALDRFVAERLLPAYEQLGLSYDAAERTLFTSTSSSPATSPGRRSRRDLRAPSRRGGPPVERTFA